jgi:hypothetical protein
MQVFCKRIQIDVRQQQIRGLIGRMALNFKEFLKKKRVRTAKNFALK